MITMMAICIVKFTRLQKPVPNDTTTFFGPAPIDNAPAATTSTARPVNTKASGNQRSLHSVTPNATRWSSPSCVSPSGDASPPRGTCAREVDSSDCFIASPVQNLLESLCRLQVRKYSPAASVSSDASLLRNLDSAQRSSRNSTIPNSDPKLLCSPPCCHLSWQIGGIGPGHEERLRFFVGSRGAKNQGIGEFIADQLQCDRQAVAGKSARHRRCRLLRKVERISKRRPFPPAVPAATRRPFMPGPQPGHR